jgi:hypothetical protein
MEVGASLALAVRLAAHGLIAESGWFEGLLAVTAGAKRQIVSPGIVSSAIP